MTSSADRDETREQVEEGEAQRYLEHDDPDAERERAGLGGEEGSQTEPLPDQRRDET